MPEPRPVVAQPSLLPAIVPGVALDPPAGRRRRYRARDVVARVLMLGGGLQSSFMADLVAEGELPRPDLAIFNDNGCEPATVYQEVGLLRRRLAAAGVPLREYRATCTGLVEDTKSGTVRGSMPVWVENADGSRGRRADGYDYA